MVQIGTCHTDGAHAPGNLRDIFMVPSCFHSISHLDLSLISPWGYPLTSACDPGFIVAILRRAFPSITSLTLYARNPYTITLVAPLWPNLKHVKLVRWHQRPQIAAVGDELKILFSLCEQLTSLDLSLFYCWTDDVLPTLESYPSVACNLTHLNLLNPSFSDGFRSHEIIGITGACPNLQDFRAACLFDPRYIGFIDDEALVAISTNCPKLAVLHLAETSALSNARANLEDEVQTPENSRISASTLIEMFSGLPLLEELVFDICNIIRDSGPALEALKSKCPKLKSLKLGQFHGISLPVESKLDGVALCQGLESLSISSAGDLSDMGLIAIGRGCCALAKIEVHGCENITIKGMRTLASLLHKTLKEVKISSCKHLGASATLRALEPIQDRIKKLHFDCIWDSTEDIDDTDEAEDLDQYQSDVRYRSLKQSEEHHRRSTISCPTRKKRRISYDLSENGHCGSSLRTWDKLQSLSIWIPVGQLLTPLASAGIEKVPNLEEITIKVEGDCRELSKPVEREFGLSSLLNYPKLSRMNFDCSDTIGYAHTAPSGQMDLSLWERFHLIGIGHLNLRELDYWPPQDRDVNQRSLSLPAAGLLQECIGLRKLFIHGTTHEHFMMFLLRIPNLRDVQLREDYYPAPENDMSTEMRADSCSRFEAALNERHIPD